MMILSVDFAYCKSMFVALYAGNGESFLKIVH